VNSQSSEDNASTQIVVADDHPLMRSALSMLLEAQSDLRVVGEAANGRQALELCRSLLPEIALLDLVMPDMDGLAATHAIKRELPNTAVLIITAFGNPDTLSAAVKAGADGYVIKESSPQEVVDAIRKVLIGEPALNQELGMQLLRRLVSEEEEQDPPRRLLEGDGRAHILRELTRREAEVLRLMARGLTNQQIARSLLISVSTAKKHVHNTISKLGVSDRVQAAVKVTELGLIDDRDH
jgi:NarL family two-component system response regulator LiaR